jgi:cytochrome oxidase Cu insertion factor (SCO1/SenC/PrrC family)
MRIRNALLFTLLMTLSIPVLPATNERTPEEVEAAARAYFTDTILVNQDSQEVRFFSDVLKGQVVAINFIFTSCLGACPMITEKMKMARNILGEELGNSIRFISISIDPARDTPAAMKEFKETHRADGNWVFLTGKKENLDNVVKRLGQYYPEVEEHSTLVIAGNVAEQHWMKIMPTVPPGGIAEKLRLLISGS